MQFRGSSAAQALVRVGGVPSFMGAMISRMIGALQCREPGLTVQQSYMNLPEIAATLEAGQTDLGIVPIGTLNAGHGFEFTEILPGRTIVACRPDHALMRKRPLEAREPTPRPWVAPQHGSPFMSDLQMILISVGMSDLDIRCSGGTLMSVVSVLAETDALAVLPLSAAFGLHKKSRVTVLPYGILRPDRSLGILRQVRAPAAEWFSAHIIKTFEDLKHVIKRHENAVVWGR